MPAAQKKLNTPIEAEELDVTVQDHAFTIPVDGNARVQEEGCIQIIDGPRALQYKDKADALAFNEEKVVIRIAESTNKNDQNPIELGVNGRTIVLWRGFEYIVARKYLEKLARCKTTRIEQEAIEQNGVKGYRNDRRTAHTFPFSVLRDDNPLGRAWLDKVSAEQ